MSKAFEFLLEQAQEKEKKAMTALGKANAELNNYYEQIAQIEKYRLDYCQQLLDRGMSGLTASQYTHLNRFLTQLDETLSKQKEAESHFKDQVSQCQEHWMAMRKQRRSMEWMIDKKAAEKQRLLDKQEQKQMDEFSTLQFARKNLKI